MLQFDYRHNYSLLFLFQIVHRFAFRLLKHFSQLFVERFFYIKMIKDTTVIKIAPPKLSKKSFLVYIASPPIPISFLPIWFMLFHKTNTVSSDFMQFIS